MPQKIDKRDRARLFRSRLGEALELSTLNQSGLARQTGVDRSTISQLLSSNGTRLPNAHVIGECASALGVSADWLLGLSDRPELMAELLAASVTMTAAPRALVDDQIFSWHQEAAGYKIRHVPATLPDMLKTRAMLEWEYAPQLGRSTEQAIGASQDKLELMRSSRSDTEVALPMHELGAFIRAEGYYSGLPAHVREAQLDQLADLNAQLYPRLRVYLFDARRVFSSPITIFGTFLAVLYLGRNYLAFRDRERVEAITDHFDGLIKQAAVPAHEFGAKLADMRKSR